MTVIDAHQHVWDLEAARYPWLTADLGALHRTWLEDELEPHLSAAGVDRTILVQAANSLEDTELMLRVADRWPRVIGVVGWLPLLDPAATAATLERWQGEPLLVGARHLIHDEQDPDWLVQPPVLESLKLIAAAGLAFDVVAVLPRHLEHVPVVAAACPGLRLVIDHLAKPPIVAGEWEPWSTLLAAAAGCPDVHAKISGLTTAADPDRWHTTMLQPYVDRAIELFGPERLMLGGDWPVSTVSGSYPHVWNDGGVRTIDHLSAEQRAQILGGSATRVYRLPG